MVDENQLALNVDADGINEVASGGTPTPDHPIVSPDSQNIYSTVEDDIPGPSPTPDDKGDKKTGADEEVAKKAADDKAALEAEVREKVLKERYDSDPRFQELIQGNKELRERLAKTEGHLEGLARGSTAEKTDLGYIDITTKTDEELREWQESDPKGYAANMYAQIRGELSREHDQRDDTQSRNAQVKKTFDDYASKNSDFMSMWDSGDIPKFMQQNPGHNAISAHIMLTAEKHRGESEKQMTERIAKAVKEAEDKVTKNFQAKRTATKVLSGGGAPPPNADENELTDTKSRGGLTAVITERLKRMRGGVTA